MRERERESERVDCVGGRRDLLGPNFESVDGDDKEVDKYLCRDRLIGTWNSANEKL